MNGMQTTNRGAMSPPSFTLVNGVILTPRETIRGCSLRVCNGRIEALTPASAAPSVQRQDLDAETGEVIDVGGRWIAPGFIDIHTHGAGGIDAAVGPCEAMTNHLTRCGVTGFLPTFWNIDIDLMEAGFRNIRTYMETQHQRPAARILGINAEGPFINPERGAQSGMHALNPTPELTARLLAAAGGTLKIMTVSSELPGYPQLVKTLRSHGVHVALGYCGASPPRLQQALALGISHIDHIFDCFSDPVPLEGGVKAWGIEEELLVSDDLYAEVIADRTGAHVPPVLLKILLRCKGTERIILISDSRDVAGFPPGRYRMADGMEVVISEREDVVRLACGSLAGSVMGMDDAVRNMMNHTGITVNEAVTMASANPAAFLGLADRKGALAPGMDADIVVFDDNIEVFMTVTAGSIAYRRDPS